MTSKDFHSINDSNIRSLFKNINVFHVFNDNNNNKNVILVTNDDKTYAFGGNAFGVLGFGHKKQINEITANKALSDKQVIDFKSGFQHMIARTTDGQVYAWGYNKWGVLGTGRRNENIQKSKRIKYLKKEFITDISTGFWHSLALTVDGRVYSWGDNTWGQTGFASYDKNIGYKPKLLNGFDGERVVSISCGAYHSLALTASGHVFSWGQNESGQLGIGQGVQSIANYPMPILDIGLKFAKIRAGFDHNLLLSKEGFIYTFGCNECGELGLSTCATKAQFSPKKVKTLEKFIDIETNNSHPFCTALSVSGQYYMWGFCGQLCEELIFAPKLMKTYKSFEELFIEKIKITNKTIAGFDDYFKEKIV